MSDDPAPVVPTPDSDHCCGEWCCGPPECNHPEETDMDPDPYGEEFGDWEDPFEHDSCTGCDMCKPWEGRPYEIIREERRLVVAVRRAEAANNSAAVKS